MAKKKYYAVKKGRKPGIYNSWAETQKQVSGFSGAQFKSFSTKEKAQLFIKPNDSKRPNKISEIIIYTDGGSRNHGNKLGQHVKSNDSAAWAYLINNNGQKYSNSAGEFGATNNKMEVLGLVNALDYLNKKDLNNCNIDAILDSKYVLNAINNKWIYGWKKRGWRKSNGEVIKNKTEFIELDSLLSKFPNIHFYWTKGHSNDEGNNFVDHLLNKTMDDLENGKKMNLKQLNENKTSDTIKSKNKMKNTDNYIDKEKSVNNIENNLKQMGFFS
ncbi:ribonuclease H family protein [Apilactobacillus quenuiae]|uniref:ribonuclease H family protein n=1 Tax=Apilactobacillus quenuiae TaxID=2008377 RepID=UPI000D01B828|nr:ribonuclease H family protein [Apilactobacillus quenuiae]